jgi:DNA-binding HxlR family transcriptional regulator
MKLQKETDRPRIVHGRWYDDACGTAFALELVGERWALLIVRELMFGARRFSDLRGGLPGISAKVLTERLDGLERAGIVRRRHLPPPAAAQVYELTAWGYQAEPVLQELGRWAAMSPDHDPTLPLSAASLIISFRTMFDPPRADGLTAEGALTIAAERGEAARPDFTLAAPSAMPIAALVYGKAASEQLPELGVSGDRQKLASFVDCFHLPAKAR